MPPEPTFDVDVALRLGALDLRARFATFATRLALVGPSGAGKTTLLRVLAGLEPTAQGRIRVRGQEWLAPGSRRPWPPWERRAAWVPQESRLFPHLSVRRNLGFGGGSPAEVEALAARLGIGALLERRARHLSGGEAQRVALGRALLARPRVLLLDEPFAALDRPRRREVLESLRRLTDERSLPFVLVTHDERDVASLAEETYTLRDGVLEEGPPPPAVAPAAR